MISIIIPVYNAEENLEKCLKHILESTYKDYEIIVVDDCSDDGSGKIAKRYTENVITLNKRSGPSMARNIGTQKAKGKVLLFIDADIFIMSDTIHRIANFLNENKHIDGVTGLYAEQSPSLNFCSRYKHLYLRYKYINCPEFVSMPNTALLAVREDSFKKVKGFNTYMFTCEDFEFGQRFSKAGYKIYNDKNLAVIHNRYFSFGSLVYKDFTKAVNLTHLFLIWKNDIYRYPGEKGILSISIKQQLGIIFTTLLLINLCLLFFHLSPVFIATELILLSFTIMANMDFWRFQWKGESILFKIQSFLFTYLEHLLSAIAVITAIFRRIFKKSKGDFGLAR